MLPCNQKIARLLPAWCLLCFAGEKGIFHAWLLMELFSIRGDPICVVSAIRVEQPDSERDISQAVFQTRRNKRRIVLFKT